MCYRQGAGESAAKGAELATAKLIARRPFVIGPKFWIVPRLTP